MSELKARLDADRAPAGYNVGINVGVNTTVGIAGLYGETRRHVRFASRMGERRVLCERPAAVTYRRQRLVIDFDQLRAVRRANRERLCARLREVGTTNRTRLADFRAALSPDTGMILKLFPPK